MHTLIAPLSGWGRYPVSSCELERPERYAGLDAGTNCVIARGQGRSYGDAALNENGRVLLTERINRFLEFDEVNGVLRAEAGATLAEVLALIVPRGWFLPVTPGTKFVSLGGCIASDVHGKNHHHNGSFGEHVLSLEMILADGRRTICSPDNHADLFWATVGGMGLTGVIGAVSLKLIPTQSALMNVRHHVAENLDQLFGILEDRALDDRYAVAWIDTLAVGRSFGRGIAMFGHHAAAEELPPRAGDSLADARAVPHRICFDMPGWILNPITIGAFNAAYFRHQGNKRRPFFSAYDRFFYPLDSITGWNRMYGKRGFVQYQCVISEGCAFEGIKALLQEVSASRRPSFLAVLKRLGAQGSGMLSFPMAGYTLALDLPIQDHGLFKLLDKLDTIVLQHDGRVYLAKDARLSEESFRGMYPRYAEWLAIKANVDPHNKFSSNLSRRLRTRDG
jgi:decaprenylphospho-beta-D-ribofuranose 2-oxidase